MIDNELKLEEIPQELIEELNKLGNVVFELGSQVTPTTKTFKCVLQITPSKELVESTVMNPETFVTCRAKGYYVDGFFVRIDGNIIRRVQKHTYFKSVELID